MFFTRGDCP